MAPEPSNDQSIVMLGILSDQSKNTQITLNEHGDRLTTLENANGNGTTSSVYCHVDNGDYGNGASSTGNVSNYNSFTLLPFTQVVAESTSGIYDSSTKRFTPGVAGLYMLHGQVNINWANANGVALETAFHKNSTSTNPHSNDSTNLGRANWTYNSNYPGYVAALSNHVIVRLTATDYVQMTLYANPGSIYIDKGTKFMLYRIA